MTMNRTPLNTKRFKTTYTKRSNNRSILKNKWKNIFLKFLIYSILLFVISSIIIWIVLYNKYIVWLPSIKELENLEIAETSIIYDRDWNELYKIYKEKRTYVPFENINKNMVNALISIEDKRYWTNPWVDIKWLIRAWLNYILWKADWVKWTSTLTQQLIRNTIIKNEKSVERKIKEIYLAYKLTSTLSKEKIIELYLNKIEYWHNSFGIEEASRTFFGKSSKDLSIIESSFLASLPKWPTYYSPYNYPDRLIGYPYFYENDNKKDITKIITKTDKEKNIEILTLLTDFIKNLKANRLEWTDRTLICNISEENFKSKVNIDEDWCLVISYPELISFLNNIRIKSDNKYIEYETWRKDRVIWRMLEDWYINFDEYKETIIDGIGYTFSKSKENIKSPHFVFYVKEYLEEKFWQEIVNIWWLKIYTTLDWKLQEKAEELIRNQVKKNLANYDADNAALISIDNKTWEILSMVWWKDYFNIEEKWNVNIITSKLQPWSTFKPFVYSLWMYKNIIWTKTPVYDLETVFPSWYTPSNFDGKFMWKIDISTALSHSRNIPAIKMFFMAWWEKSIVELMKKLWVKSLKENNSYGAPLWLWTWEMTPLELASAYSVFANLWVKKEISPILKIIDSKGNIIEEKMVKQKDEKVISDSQTYIINSILSDTSSRPSSWNNYITIKNRQIASKTGTSTKQYVINWKKVKYPSNLWTIWYTPQITTVVWAWNTDGKELNNKWNWLEWAWPVMRDFMEFAHIWKPIEKWEMPSSVKQINISEISWLLPNPENTNNLPYVNSLFVNSPNEYDNSYKQIEVDSLCNWKVTEDTPKAAIKKVTVLKLNWLDPSNKSWQDPIDKWTKTDDFKTKYGNFWDLITNVSDEPCERKWTNNAIKINTSTNDNDIFIAWENYVNLSFNSLNPIIRIDIIIDDMIVDDVEIDNKKNWTYEWKIFIPVSKVWKQWIITFRAVDNQYYSNEISKNILIVRKDAIPIVPDLINDNTLNINLTNPVNWSIKLYNTDFFNLKASITGNSILSSVNILINWNIIEKLGTERNIAYPINSDRDLTIWKYIVTIEVIDNYQNKITRDIQLEILQR